MIRIAKHINRCTSFARSFAIVVLVCVASNQLKAQTATEYQVKAVFLYNFTRFVEWPEKSFENSNSPFVIGIVGKDPFGEYLDATVNGESVGNHRIVIQRYNSLNEVEKCHILFITAPEAGTTKNGFPEFRDRHTLTVSDGEDFAATGGMIGFFLEKNKIRMQVNTSEVKAASLTISSKLLSVARVL